jgi:hypothetical protein
VKRARQIDGDHIVPFLDGKFFDRTDVLNTCVVDQDINMPPGFLDSVNQVFNLRGLTHVSTMKNGFDPQRLNVMHCLVMRSKSVECNVCARLGEAFGNAQPDATGRTGDQRCFTC